MLLKILKQNWQKVLLTTLFGAVVGVLAFYLIPSKYIATGSFYVKRMVQSNGSAYFSYEGYYGQQTAQAYTGTLMGLLESTDIKSLALNKLNIEVTESSLRKFSRNVNVTKSAPQLITLSVKSTSGKSAEDKWQALSQSALDTATILNQSGDPFITISKVSQAPIVKMEFRNLAVNFGIGLGLGFIISVFILTLKKYLQ